jgi:type IV pilus assembly protein PilO
MRFGFRELVFILLLLAVPAAAYFFVFSPRNVQIAQMRDEIRIKRAKLEQLSQATASMKDLGAEIDRLTQAVKVFEQKLPAQREVEVLLNQATELAGKQRLGVKSLRTDKAVAAAQYSEQPIKMVIVGDFDGFYSFLLDLERLKRITRMNQMQLKRIQNDEGQMQAEITLSIFFDPSGDNSKNAAPKPEADRKKGAL